MNQTITKNDKSTKILNKLIADGLGIIVGLKIKQKKEIDLLTNKFLEFDRMK